MRFRIRESWQTIAVDKVLLFPLSQQRLLMQDRAEQCTVNLDIPIVANEAQNLFMKWLTRDRVVPTISANVS
jgi:flagellar assembly factor FliW